MRRGVNTGGHLMQHGRVDLVIVGSDRTTRNGDVCNKIGTYLKALAARANGVPFMVAMPLSTLRAKIDYGFTEASTPQGNIGVQVWINQGMYEDDANGDDAQAGQAPKKPKRTYKR